MPPPMSDVASLRWERTTRTDGATCYALPPRPLSLTRLKEALLGCLFGLGLAVAGGTLAAVIAAAGLRDYSTGSLFWLLAFLGLCGLGLLLLRNGLTDLPQARHTIEVCAGRLRTVDRLGWLRRTRASWFVRLHSPDIEGTG